jgi:mRNA interferase HigB
MIIKGVLFLEEFRRQHAQSGVPIDIWLREIVRNNYRGFMELRKTFPKADYVYHQYTIFNISGNKYRLITFIDYPKNIVLIKRIWTHAEYSKRRNQDLLRGWKL